MMGDGGIWGIGGNTLRGYAMSRSIFPDSQMCTAESDLRAEY